RPGERSTPPSQAVAAACRPVPACRCSCRRMAARGSACAACADSASWHGRSIKMRKAAKRTGLAAKERIPSAFCTSQTAGENRSPGKVALGTSQTGLLPVAAVYRSLAGSLIEVPFVIFHSGLAAQVTGVAGQRLALALQQDGQVGGPVADLRHEGFD